MATGYPYQPSDNPMMDDSFWASVPGAEKTEVHVTLTSEKGVVLSRLKRSVSKSAVRVTDALAAGIRRVGQRALVAAKQKSGILTWTVNGEKYETIVSVR
jgi:hypothetical protein